MTKPRQNSSIWSCVRRRRNGKCRRVNGARRKPSSPSCSKTGSSWHDGQPAPHTRFLIVPSRGGLTTKIHLAVRGLGCPVRFVLTAGQAGDAPQAARLLEDAPAEAVIAATAYDADHIRAAIAEKNAEAVIPSSPSRSRKYQLDTHLYAQRHLVECCISKLKQFRRVATRFEKTAQNYLAVVTIAAIVLWLR